MGNTGSIKLGKRLAYGATSEILLPKEEKKYPNIVIKKIHRHHNYWGKNEILYLSNYKHPNIITMVDYYEHRSHVYICLEKMDTDLFEHCVDNVRISVSEIKSYFSQICSAVEFLHKRGIAHRDIKLENILLCKTRNIVKLCDFGFAIEERMSSDKCGSISYLAPEVVKSEPHYSCPLDIWALGVCLYALVYNNLPFVLSRLDTNEEICGNILQNKPKYPEFSDKKLVDLTRLLLTSEPEKRPKITDITSLSFLAENDEEPSVVEDEELSVKEKPKGLVLV